MLNQILNRAKFRLNTDSKDIKYRRLLNDNLVNILGLKQLSTNYVYCLKCDKNDTYNISEFYIPNLKMHIQQNNVTLIKNDPFDLERALAGEPVELRCGLKAYIYAKTPDILERQCPLLGYIILNSGDISEDIWFIDGVYRDKDTDDSLDIVGMWNEE